MSNEKSCCCGGGGIRLLYACSGAADVGSIADSVARRLSKEGVGSMTCIAAIGAGLDDYINSAKKVVENITIDGCPKACSKKALENIGVKPTSYILTEMGLEKGKTPPTQENIDQIAGKISQLQKEKRNESCS
jgi:uncharacterized metal-binding protein